MTEYEKFLARKMAIVPPCGFDPDPSTFPEAMKPFQRDLTTWALRRGCAALFEGTGLGKTLQQLTWARAVADHTSGRILILAPLAVAFQTVAEAVKFGIDGVAYAADENAASTDIVVTNYERRHLFDLSQFAGIVLDESSIIKSDDSKTRKELMESAVSIPYRLCCTATPAPNDWTELGQHAEFLGVMSAKEMLAMFFVHDGSVRADNALAEEWRLKGHAEKDFWRWVSSWAVMLRSPVDLGYDEPGYVLPPLNLHQITVDVEYKTTGGMLFPSAARTMAERLAVRRDSIEDRVAAELVNGQPDRQWLIWCHMNAEGDALAKAIQRSINVQGSDSPEKKAEQLLGFCQGNPWNLITKGKIGGFGLNWQHCDAMVFVGLNDSFETLFQSLRRCWRFGQTRPVDAYLIASELEGAVVANLRDKERKYDAMAAAMLSHMQGLTINAVRGGRVTQSTYEPKMTMELPQWMTA